MINGSRGTARLRKNFGKIPEIIDIPNLIEVQKKSYQVFLQLDVPPESRKNVGLQGVLNSVFPIWDFNRTASLEFKSYSLGEPKYSVVDCRQRGMTYSAPLKVVVQLVVWDVDELGESRAVRDVKEQEVYFGEIPLMTENGTFVVNGTERVIVSQLHRSPGVFFDHDKSRSQASGKLLYSARIIPYRGSWLDFEFDHKDLVYVRIDRRRSLLVTTLFRAMGCTDQEMLDYFFRTESILIKQGKFFKSSAGAQLVGQRLSLDLVDPKNKEVILRAGRRVTKLVVKRMQEAGLDKIPVSLGELVGEIVARPELDRQTGEVILECNEELTLEKLKEIAQEKLDKFEIVFINPITAGSYIRDTLAADKTKTREEALIEIYRRLRPGDPSTPEMAIMVFEGLFSRPERYDLSPVGRLKLNYKLKLQFPLSVTTLQKEDILATVRYLVGLKNGQGEVDDIDHLGNRRVRTVGELLENQYRVGLARMERAIKERLSLQDVETMMPYDLVNPKPVTAVVKEFFGSSQLSQFMDQTNPLSEITHKRRLSALGPGGLTRERAGFEVRDVHPTHYGRICPIETPEGPNIGLIASLSTYGRINEFGFIETPYREAADGKVTNKIRFLTAMEEQDRVIAQANAPLDNRNRFTHELISCRRGGEFVMARREDVNFMDVSPKQLVSVAASLIPFLEHDDANRALMGANMQRQAVPLLKTEAPLIGTGMEGVAARDSGAVLLPKRSGTVESVDASRIVIKADGSEDAGVDIYNLVKCAKSNQNTCINQRPIVQAGQKVLPGQVIADGPATDQGELALGKNVLVAFMPWGGYNFEDSILVSERLVKNDSFTSIHIEELEIAARETKLGKEEMTADIPNIGEEVLKDLDESGIIRIGAEVKPGDILVGKVTPKGEQMLYPEEKLLRAIFGDKAGEVRDTSLRVPPGMEGTVIGVKVFARKGADKDPRSKTIENEEIGKLEKDRDDEIRIIRYSCYRRVKKLLLDKATAASLASEGGRKVIVPKGKKITEEILSKLPRERWGEIRLTDGGSTEAEIEAIIERMKDQVDLVRTVYGERIGGVRKGDELPPGVIKMIKVSIAMKCRLQVGDKMAGRHGNKGVISRILPEEDMPYLADGTPVDVVLNPLGVPSRMNVGQILETHLGLAARGMGQLIESYLSANGNGRDLRKRLERIYNSPTIKKLLADMSDDEVLEMAHQLRNGLFISSPVFDGASEEEVKRELEGAGMPTNGQVSLYDGRTGQAFPNAVTVGVMYIMKLHHLVDDKIHARAIGPYSLVTQQPLGGKAQFGGQRFGEMEVWAMEAFGAAYTLQELLTVKSDDIPGRTRIYEAIVKGQNTLEAGLPESFNVLIKELQSLCLNVELLENEENLEHKPGN